MNYEEFLADKQQHGSKSGFRPIWLPTWLFDFQTKLLEWSIEKGRSAIFADCGLGKTPMQLVWAQNVVEHTNRPVLVLTPLAVSSQTAREGAKFGIEVVKSQDGKIPSKITVANYERLHYFDANEFAGVVADESSILKNFDGVTRAAVTEFMRRVPYRLLCTATAAPNDYIELGTSSQALGEMGYMDMLGMFFKTSDSSGAAHGGLGGVYGKKANALGGKFRFRGHAEHDFWRWVCSWARALRKPSDVGCEDSRFVLPKMKTEQHTIKARSKPEGFLFDMPAHGLQEQRKEQRRTIEERCELAASLVNNTGRAAVVWCNLNDEGNMVEKMVPDAMQVSGADSDDKKEEILESFAEGKCRVLVTKGKITGMGLNWQHCAHQTWFPSHSFEQFYQGTRRSWRFGQKNTVHIDVITSEGQADVLASLQRKTAQAEVMFSRLVELMNDELRVTKKNGFTQQQTNPAWLS